jgi:hypothetical protein
LILGPAGIGGLLRGPHRLPTEDVNKSAVEVMCFSRVLQANGLTTPKKELSFHLAIPKAFFDVVLLGQILQGGRR